MAARWLNCQRQRERLRNQSWRPMVIRSVRSALGAEHENALFDVIALSPRQDRLLLTHRKAGKHHLWVWETSSGTLRELIGHTGAVPVAAFFPDGQRIVTAGEDGTLRLWDAATGHELLALPHAGTVAVAVSPDGRRLLTVSRGSGAVIWTAEDWRASTRASVDR